MTKLVKKRKKLKSTFNLYTIDIDVNTKSKHIVGKYDRKNGCGSALGKSVPESNWINLDLSAVGQKSIHYILSYKYIYLAMSSKVKKVYLKKFRDL